MIVDRLCSLAGLGKRATYRNPEVWMFEAFGALDTDAGITVSEKKALQVSAVFCAVSVISGSLRTLPLRLYRARADGGREHAYEHPAYPLLTVQPNPMMTPAQFKAYMQSSALLWHGGFAWIQRTNGGVPAALWPLHPSRVTPKIEDDGRTLYHEVRKQNTGEMVKVSDADMLRIYGVGCDGVTGVSLIEMARQAIALGLATEKHGAKFFSQGASPRGVLVHPGKLSERAHANIKDAWRKEQEGVDQAHRVPVLEEGMKFEPIGMSPEVTQFLETRQFQIEEIARWFNIPPHKLKHLLRATFDNIEQQNIEYYVDTMLPWLVTWEEELNAKLLTPDERGEYYTKFSVQGLLRGDAKSRAEFYRNLWGIGVLNPNEIRQFEELNPIEGGDTYYVPVNMMSAERLALAPMPMPDKEPRNMDSVEAVNKDAVHDAARMLLQDAFGRIVTREVDRIQRAVKRAGSDSAAFGKWVGEFYAEQRDIVGAALAVPLASMEHLGCALPLANEIGRWYTERHECALRSIANSSGDWANQIERLLSVWETGAAVECAMSVVENGNGKTPK